MKQEIIALLDKLDDEQLKLLYKELKVGTCDHDNIVNKKDSAYCKDCEDYVGHYCPKSLDHLCQYYSEQDDKGCYVMIKNQRVDLPTDHEQEDETDDHCLFCGQPEERK